MGWGERWGVGRVMVAVLRRTVRVRRLCQGVGQVGKQLLNT